MKTKKQKAPPLTLEQQRAVKLYDDGEPDRLWTLDNSRRRFRVRPMREGECCDQWEYQIGHDIVIIYLPSVKWITRFLSRHTELVIDPFDSENPTPGTYQDSDAWALKVWKARGMPL